jgi:hypothetical protein
MIVIGLEGFEPVCAKAAGLFARLDDVLIGQLGC